MTDSFKVGDKVVMDGVDGPHTVTWIGRVFVGGGMMADCAIIDARPNEARLTSRFTIVPPEKPKYRLVWEEPSFVKVVMEGRHRNAGAVYGPSELAKTVEEAEAMVRAAMAAVGYEEETK